MWTKTKIAFASALLLSAAGAANAADLIVDEVALEAAVPSGDWTGAYVGGNIGYASGTVNWEIAGGGPPEGSYDLDGLLVGVQGGYNWQMDSIVFGVEGDVAFSGVAGEDVPLTAARQVNWVASLRGRLGFAVESILLYGTAGVAIANSTGEFFIFDDTETHVGWTVGLGVEAMVTDDVSAKLEYAYTDYGTQEYSYGGLPIDTGFTTHAIKAGVNFHF
jgi:outer membrane immunogenic protein